VISCLTAGAFSQHHHGVTKMCKWCEHSHSEECHSYEKCPDEQCSVEVRILDNGVKSWKYGCSGHHECENPVNVLNVLGKRQPGHHHEGQLVCLECCDTNLCNKDLCSNFKHTTTTTSTTTTTTAAPVTQKPTQPPTDAPTTVQPACHNDEAVFQCSELDKYNFCTDTSSVAYAIAHDHCAKYCGFCGPNATVTDMPAPIDVTDIVNIVTQGPVVMTSVAQVACVDVEDPTLSCQELRNLGFCAPGSGTGHTFAELRCPKTCNLCDGDQ